MSAPLPDSTLHLLVADEGLTEGRVYRVYVTLCHALVPASGLPPSLCPDGCDQEHRYCPGRNTRRCPGRWCPGRKRAPRTATTTIRCARSVAARPNGRWAGGSRDESPAGIGWRAVSWYLRSMVDRDTHRGELNPDGTVVAQCGIRFAPRPLLLGRIALPGHPQDRDQICPECYQVKRTR